MSSSFFLRGISMPNLNSECQLLAPDIQSLEQVAIQCTQRSDVDYGDTLSIPNLQQLIEDWEEHSLSLARSSRCDEKNILTADNFRNSHCLGWSWGSESRLGNRLLDHWRQEREDLLRQSSEPTLAISWDDTGTQKGWRNRCQRTRISFA